MDCAGNDSEPEVALGARTISRSGQIPVEPALFAKSAELTLSEGFDSFVTSTTASAATGCSDPLLGRTSTH